jgi:hypothetical protein
MYTTELQLQELLDRYPADTEDLLFDKIRRVKVAQLLRSKG